MQPLDYSYYTSEQGDFKGDFKQDLLHTQLETFAVHFKQVNEDITGLNMLLT